MGLFSKIFAHCKPAAKIERQEIDDAYVELGYVTSKLRDAKEELKRTQEKINASHKVAEILVKKAKAAELSIKRAKVEIARNKKIDNKIKADRIEDQRLWDNQAQFQREVVIECNRSLESMRAKVAHEEIRARSEIKAIHQAIKDAALSRP